MRERDEETEGRIDTSGHTKGGSIAIQLTSCLTGLDKSVFQIKTKIVSCHTSDSKSVKQEVNGTVILPPLVFPGHINTLTSKCFFLNTSIKIVSYFVIKF